MAAPNIAGLTTITGKTAFVTPGGTSPVVLLANEAASGKVLKINTIMAANIDGTNAYSATVAYNTASGGGGTSYALASTISVPANASLIVTDKSNSFYLEEDRSIVVTNSSANKITFMVSYEEIG